MRDDEALDNALYGEQADPLDAQPIGFDWKLLSSALGENERDVERNFDDLRFGLRAILRWVLNRPATTTKGGYLKTVGMRIAALGWVLDPSLFNGTPSLRELAERIGCHPMALSRTTAKFSKGFGVSNRSQFSHAWRYRRMHSKATNNGSHYRKASG